MLIAEQDVGQELVAGARRLIGVPAVLHYELAGNCMGDGPSPRCSEIGIDPGTGLDCSGLVLAALGLSHDPSNRHVRNWWQQGTVGDLIVEKISSDLHPFDLQPGDLVIWSRRYQGKLYPGHVGVVTEVANDSYKTIHTSSRHKKVIEQSFDLTKARMGVLRFS